MATLNTNLGWSQGDQVRLLIASGLTVGSYQIEQITVAMNQLGTLSLDAVDNVLQLIDEFEAAQLRYTELNASGDSRILIKADVLEWTESKGFSYNPLTEILRIQGLLKQYFSFSELYQQTNTNVTNLIRS